MPALEIARKAEVDVVIVVMNTHSQATEVDHVMGRLRELGLAGHLSQGTERCVIGVVGQTFPELRDMLEGLPGVEEVVPISKPYKLSGREFQDVSTVVELVASYADILQIGTRNMQNFFLLDAVGKLNRPVMLKRGLSATIQEWLLAAEYILAQGNRNVILCERGIRTYETFTRNTMDI